jgi:hypothetical protein
VSAPFPTPTHTLVITFCFRARHGQHTNFFNSLLKFETDYVCRVFANRTYNKHLYNGYFAEPIATVLNGFPRQGVDTVEAPDEPDSALAPLSFCLWNSPHPPPDFWPRSRVNTNNNLNGAGQALPSIASLV